MNLSEVPLLRQSERAAFKRCPWAWFQAYVKMIRPIYENKTAAEFGTLIHLALATYYIPGTKRGPHPAETFDDLAKHQVDVVRTTEYENDELVAKWVGFRQLGVELMEGYVDHYGGDPHWDILDPERRFDVVIPDTRQRPIHSAKGRQGFKPIVTIVGTFDLCLRDLNDGKVKMVDHKTATYLDTDHLVLDEQASTYILVGTTALRHQGLIGPKDAIDGMEYNFIKKTSRFKAPLKDHYLDALYAYYHGDQFNAVDSGLEAPPGLFTDTKAGTKWLKEDLAKHCEELRIEVRGEEDPGKQIYMRHFVPRTPKERQRQIVRISEEARVMDDVRHGRLPLLKTPTKECRFCGYYNLCELDESGGDTEYFEETTMKKHDPYFDHREGAINSKRVDNNAAQA